MSGYIWRSYLAAIITLWMESKQFKFPQHRISNCILWQFHVLKVAPIDTFGKMTNLVLNCVLYFSTPQMNEPNFSKISSVHLSVTFNISRRIFPEIRWIKFWEKIKTVLLNFHFLEYNKKVKFQENSQRYAPHQILCDTGLHLATPYMEISYLYGNMITINGKIPPGQLSLFLSTSRHAYSNVWPILLFRSTDLVANVSLCCLGHETFSTSSAFTEMVRQ